MTKEILYSMTLLNITGDITIGWTADQAPMMIEILEKKMAEGYTFFILADDGREIRLKTKDQLTNVNSVTIGDKEAEQLIRDGKIGLVDVVQAAELNTIGRAKTAEEISTNRTVATQPMRGG